MKAHVFAPLFLWLLPLAVLGAAPETTAPEVPVIKVDERPEALFVPARFTSGAGFHLADTDDFFPLGWNDRNEFAYLTVEKGWFGLPRAVLRVQNLASDETRISEGEEFRPGEDFEGFWKRVCPHWAPILTEAGIVRTSQQLAYFPMIHDYDFLSLVLDKKKASKGDPLYSSWTLSLKSHDRGRKVIASGDRPVVEIRETGFLLSPFEGRAAVLILSQAPGWGGLEGFGRWTVAGALLSQGF